MDRPDFQAEIRELNLAYLMLAQQMLRSDRATALFRLGIGDDLADVIESMSSHRPYRPSLGIDAAIEELEKNKTRLYDPAVVDALVRLVRNRGYSLPK